MKLRRYNLFLAAGAIPLAFYAGLMAFWYPDDKSNFVAFLLLTFAFAANAALTVKHDD
jgi:hypothetical protein